MRPPMIQIGGICEIYTARPPPLTSVLERMNKQFLQGESCHFTNYNVYRKYIHSVFTIQWYNSATTEDCTLRRLSGPRTHHSVMPTYKHMCLGLRPHIVCAVVEDLVFST